MSTTARRILVICTDQQRWDSLGCYGVTHVRTPQVDRLADEGACFERCYTVSPVCAPARASMLTGTYPHQHGLWANGVELKAENVTLLKRLRAAGYRTGLIGKFHLTACFDGREEDPGRYGFDWVRWAHDPSHLAPSNAYHHWLARCHPGLFDEALTESKEVRLRRAFRHEPSAFDRMPSEAHYTRWVGEEALEFMASQRPEQPWLLWVNFFDPHHPFVAPAEYLERLRSRGVPGPKGSISDLENRPSVLMEASRESYAGHARGFQDYSAEELAEARLAYFAMVEFIDEQVGRILEAARSLGAEEELMVLFVSDHGEMLGDHGLMLKGPMMYEGAMRVPCILRWPGRVPAGLRVGAPSSLVDIAATISGAAGIPGPPGDMGLDLSKLATGEVAPRRTAFAEYRDSGHPYTPPVWTTMVCDEQAKLVVWHDPAGPGNGRAGELYDLAADPEELHNRWDDAQFRTVRSELYEELAEYLVLPGREWGERIAFW